MDALPEGRWGLTPHQEQMLRELVAEQAEVPAPDEIPDQVEFVPPQVLKKQVRELSARVDELEKRIRDLTSHITSIARSPRHNDYYGFTHPDGSSSSLSQSTGAQTNSFSSSLSNQTNGISNSNTAALQLAQQALKNYAKKHGL